ncbi:hypothetical protein [Hymenobacter nivis]|uniref:hypothetical protein n=1 Tax=Hymenobacter nivis TaxID=1850093 RepID=UPI0013A53F7B|nr:hypothetical protein [Hymenobacter nivis]
MAAGAGQRPAWPRPRRRPPTSRRTASSKQEVYVARRAGTQLFTAICTPKGASAGKKYPIPTQRTRYSAAPYGPTRSPACPGPSETVVK